MTKVANISNWIFKYITLFFIFFLWIYFYLRNLTYSVLLSIILAILTGCIISAISRKNITHKEYLKIKEDTILKTSNSLIFADKNEILNYFCSCLKDKYDKCKIVYENCCILCKNSDEREVCIVPYFSSSLLEEKEFLAIFKSLKSKYTHIEILCVEYSNKLLQHCKRIKDFDVSILDTKTFFIKYIKDSTSIPKFDLDFAPQKKYTFNEIVVYALKREHSKNYFMSAFLLLFFSFFTLYNIYYICFASLLFLVSLACRYNIAEKYNLLKGNKIKTNNSKKNNK